MCLLEPTKNFEGTVMLRSSYYTYDGSKTNFSMGLDYFPSLSNWGRQRLQFDAGLSQDVWGDLSFSIDVFDTFDSDPPNPDADRNDVGMVWLVPSTISAIRIARSTIKTPPLECLPPGTAGCV